MKILRYTITLEEPLLATSLHGEPNSSVSLNYIPGSLLRGALIARYLHGKPAAYDLPHDDDARRLFFDGSTRYLHAYPVVNGHRLLPTPRCLAAGKHVNLREAGAQVWNSTSLQDFGKRRKYEEENGALKPISTPFAHSTGDQIWLHGPERTLAIHVQRDRTIGRATRKEGAIFRYDALAAGQVFQGIILLDTDSDASLIKDYLQLEQPLWLGRSRSAHYGRVKLSDVMIEDEWSEWQERATECAANPDPADEPHLLLFLSDAILPDSNGQIATSLTEATLAQALGISTATLTIVRKQSYVSSTIHGGYNAAARLPLPQQPAIAAGSVVAFRLTAPMDAATLTRLHQHGIGLRRAEGFGRVVLLHHLPTMLYVQSQDLSDASFDYEILSADEQKIAQGLAERLAETRRVAEILDYIKLVKFEHIPNPSQMNELRTIVRSVRVSNDPANALQQVQQRLGTMRQTARQQFERARIKRGDTTTAMLTWIRSLIEQPQEQLETLLNLSKTNVTVTGQESLPPNYPQFALDLLAAVLEKAAKQKAEESQ